MATAKVFRPVRDKFKGQIIGELDDYYVGDVTSVILGGPSTQPLKNFPGTVSTEGMIGVPLDQPVQVQQGDRLLIDGEMFAVDSESLWPDVNTLTGTAPSHAWFETTHN